MLKDLTPCTIQGGYHVVNERCVWRELSGQEHGIVVTGIDRSLREDLLFFSVTLLLTPSSRHAHNLHGVLRGAGVIRATLPSGLA